MYLSIIYLLIIIVFTILIQILPSETNLSTPNLADLGTPRSTFNDPEDQDAEILEDTLNAFNLKQHVNIPTHNLAHTIDHIIMSNDYRGNSILGCYSNLFIGHTRL